MGLSKENILPVELPHEYYTEAEKKEITKWYKKILRGAKEHIKEGDTVTVVMNEHVDYDGKQYPIASLPENLMSIIQAGGLVKAMRKLNGLD